MNRNSRYVGKHTYICIYPKYIQFLTADFISNPQFSIYRELRKQNHHQMVVYSFEKKKEANQNLDDHNDLVIRNNTSIIIPKSHELFNFYLFLQQKIIKEIYFLKNCLCVVYGLQFKYSSQDHPNWYTTKLTTLYLSNKSFLIQITDYFFIIKFVLKDIKHILYGPIVGFITYISLSKLKKNIYHNLSVFFRWILLMFQTFLLQIEEDGEDVLMKIEETDIFRRQKPGTVSFLKTKAFIAHEDQTFFEFRQFKRKTRFFFKIVALFILPFIIYRTNKRLNLEPSLPKLAYIICDFNRHDIHHQNDLSSKDNLKNGRSKINVQKYLSNFNKNALIQRSESDSLRMIHLWNINKWTIYFPYYQLTKDFFNHKKIICDIDSLLFGENKKNLNFILQSVKLYDNSILSLQKNLFSSLDEKHIYKIIYKYAFFLIKPQEIDWKKSTSSHNPIYFSNWLEKYILKNKHILFNHFEKVQNQFIKIKQQIFIKTKNNAILKYFQYIPYTSLLTRTTKWLHQNTETNYIQYLFYTKKKYLFSHTIEPNTFIFNNLLEKDTYQILTKNQVSSERIYINDFILSIETSLKNLVLNFYKNILNDLNASLEIYKTDLYYFNKKFSYSNSLIHFNEKMSFSKIDESNLNFQTQQSTWNKNMIIGLYEHKDYHYINSLAPQSNTNPNLIMQFYIDHIQSPLFIPKLEWLDTLYKDSIIHENSSFRNDIDMNRIILLFYSYYCDHIYMIQESALSFCKKIYVNNDLLRGIQYSISKIIFNEQDKLTTMWHQLSKNLDNYSLNNHLVNIQYFDHKTITWETNSTLTFSNLKKIRKSQPLLPTLNFIPSFEKNNVVKEIYPLNSYNLWQSLIKIFRKTVQINNIFLNIKNNILFDEKKSTNKWILEEESNFVSNSSIESIFNLYLYNQIEIIKQYTPWFFTSEWWSFVKNAHIQILFTCLQDLYDCILSSTLSIRIYILGKKNSALNCILENIFGETEVYTPHFSQKYSLFFEKMGKSLYNWPLSKWESIGFSPFRIDVWSYWGIIVSFISLYWFSLILGGSSFILWLMFERIRDLTNLSWSTELDILFLANSRHNKNLNLALQPINKKNKLQEQYIFSLQKWSAWLRLFFSKHIGSKLQTVWLYHTNPSDVYTGQRGLAFQLGVGETGLLGLTLYNLNEQIKHDFGYQNLRQEGLDYLKQLTKDHYKWYTNEQCNFVHSQRFISFAFYKQHSASEELWRLDNSGLIKKKYLPISLQLSHLYSRGILLVGPQDTGKSYLVKSLASDAGLPLICITIDKLIDIFEFEDASLEGDTSLYLLRENFIKFNTISKFINSIGPSIIWMPSIEMIHNSWNYTSKTKEHCTLLILRYLLQDITTILANNKNIMFLASCEDTSYLDPGFISAKRFNRFINLRIPSNLRRPQIFTKFLNSQGLEIKQELGWHSEFSNSTMGFTLRDLTAFVNEAFLISIQTKRKSLTLDDIRLVLDRGLRANETSRRENAFQKNERIQYKIGRAVIQNALVRPNPMIPLRSQYELWKPRFYFLSKAYLQSDYSESTVTQLKILPYILNCLAGSAARDAWLLLNQNIFKENLFYLNREIEHDLDLAVHLFEGIFKEFAYLDICEHSNEDLPFIPELKKMHDLVLIDQGNDVAKKAFDQYQSTFHFSTSGNETISEFEEYLEDISPEISWCSRIERLSLSRNILFDLLKKVDESLSLFSSLRFFGKMSINAMLIESKRTYAGNYHRSWDVMKSQIPKDLDYNFYGMLSKQRIKIMALPVLSEQIIEYEPPENDLLFFWGRPIWNPAATFLRNLVFRQRQLFANEELLSILYIIYQAQQSRPLILKKTRRKELWNPDAYLEKLAMDKQLEKSSKQKNIVKTPQTFHTFRRLAYANATFQRPQIEIPNNSEMSFIKRFIAPNRFSRFSFIEDICYQNNMLTQDYLTTQELLTYGSILETYHYLLKFFVKKQYLLKKLTDRLLQKGLLYEENIQKIIHSIASK